MGIPGGNQIGYLQSFMQRADLHVNVIVCEYHYQFFRVLNKIHLKVNAHLSQARGFVKNNFYVGYYIEILRIMHSNLGVQYKVTL